MDQRRLYNELRDYKRMKNRDIEISLEMDREDNKYRKKQRISTPDDRYKKNYNNYFSQKSNEVI